VSSDFTGPQRILYDIVHRVQTEILERIRALGNEYDKFPTLNDLHSRMVNLLAEELRREKVVQGSVDHDQAMALVTVCDFFINF
jgi:D-aminopeptidase